MNAAPSSRRLAFRDIAGALRSGYGDYTAMPHASTAYAALFTLPGLVLLSLIGVLGLSPLALPFAGGFMLLGPVLLGGYFELARQRELGRRPGLGDALAAFHLAPRSQWLVALICAFLFLIWITDAGVLYSFTLGGEHLPYSLGWLPEHRGHLATFTLWGSLMGAALAFMIFAISAFSVPLIYERRASLVEGINASVHTVFGNFVVCLSWGMLLGAVIVLSILLLPVLLLTLPVMSYASFALYRRAFPPETGSLDDPGEQ